MHCPSSDYFQINAKCTLVQTMRAKLLVNWVISPPPTAHIVFLRIQMVQTLHEKKTAVREENRVAHQNYRITYKKTTKLDVRPSFP